MKRLILILTCGVLCPALTDAAQEAPIMQEHATRRKTTARKTTQSKKAGSTKKTSTTAAKKKKNPRTKTTTAGSQKTKKTPAAKKARTTRTKTTTAGKGKAKKQAEKPRTKTTTAGTKKTIKSKPTDVKRVYRKGGVTYRRFNKLNTVIPQAALGSITKPTTHIISLSEPSRGYKNTDYVTFSTQDGKPAQVILKSHELTAERAQRKGLEKLSHVGQKSVEVFAGNDPSGKGLARIGEFALLNANLKGTDDLQVAIDPNGQVVLSGKNAYGSFTPLTEFSIHQ
jgi:hypothetical protein